MSVPGHIASTLAELRAKRDYLNTAIDVLAQIYEGEYAAIPPTAAPTARQPADREPAPRTRVARAAHEREEPAGDLSADARKALMVLIKAGNPLSRAEVMAKTGLDDVRVASVKVSLLRRKAIRITGTGRGARWSTTSPAGQAKEGL